MFPAVLQYSQIYPSFPSSCNSVYFPFLSVSHPFFPSPFLLVLSFSLVFHLTFSFLLPSSYSSHDRNYTPVVSSFEQTGATRSLDNLATDSAKQPITSPYQNIISAVKTLRLLEASTSPQSSISQWRDNMLLRLIIL